MPAAPDQYDPAAHDLDSGPMLRTSPWELAVAPPPRDGTTGSSSIRLRRPSAAKSYYPVIPTLCFTCESCPE